MKKSFIYTILASVLLTVILMFAGVMVGLKIAGSSIGSVVPDRAADSETVSASAGDLVAGGSDDSIKIPGFEKLVFKADQTARAADFYNPEANACYFRISFALADGMELFRSGLIKPGQKINKIEISRPMKAGTYEDAVLRYDCYTLEGLQPLNGSETVLYLEVIP